MCWNDIENGAVSVIQVKGVEELRIPLHPILARELAVMDRTDFYIVSRRDGKPLTEGDFNSIWRRQKVHLNLGPSPNSMAGERTQPWPYMRLVAPHNRYRV